MADPYQSLLEEAISSRVAWLSPPTGTPQVEEYELPTIETQNPVRVQRLTRAVETQEAVVEQRRKEVRDLEGRGYTRNCYFGGSLLGSADTRLAKAQTDLQEARDARDQELSALET